MQAQAQAHGGLSKMRGMLEAVTAPQDVLFPHPLVEARGPYSEIGKKRKIGLGSGPAEYNGVFCFWFQRAVYFFKDSSLIYRKQTWKLIYLHCMRSCAA